MQKKKEKKSLLDSFNLYHNQQGSWIYAYMRKKIGSKKKKRKKRKKNRKKEFIP